MSRGRARSSPSDHSLGAFTAFVTPSVNKTAGQPRVASHRLRLNWNDVIDVWLRKFLPRSESDKSDEHKLGRRRRAHAARCQILPVTRWGKPSSICRD